MNLKMNFFNGQTFKNYFSSRNRSLTKDQQLILELYQEKISIESFFELEKLNDFNLKSLEIGFGTGEKLLQSAISYPDNLFIGIEYYKKGIAQLLLNIEKHKLKNIRLFYGDAFDYLKLLKTNFLDEVLIMFPDPWPKKRHQKRRLVNGDFLKKIFKILKKNGKFIFSTDNISYFENVKTILKNTPKIKIKIIKRVITIKTKYYLKAERKRNKINSLMFFN